MKLWLKRPKLSSKREQTPPTKFVSRMVECVSQLVFVIRVRSFLFGITNPPITITTFPCVVFIVYRVVCTYRMYWLSQANPALIACLVFNDVIKKNNNKCALWQPVNTIPHELCPWTAWKYCQVPKYASSHTKISDKRVLAKRSCECLILGYIAWLYLSRDEASWSVFYFHWLQYLSESLHIQYGLFISDCVDRPRDLPIARSDRTVSRVWDVCFSPLCVIWSDRWLRSILLITGGALNRFGAQPLADSPD